MAKTNIVVINNEEVEMTAKEIKADILKQLPEITVDENFINLVKAIIKVSASGSGRKVESKTSVFRALLVEKQSLTEDDIWANFKWGKHEVLSVCWGFRKKGNPEDYLYVNFNKETRSYDIVGTGPEAPEGYATRNSKKAEETDQA